MKHTFLFSALMLVMFGFSQGANAAGNCGTIKILAPGYDAVADTSTQEYLDYYFQRSCDQLLEEVKKVEDEIGTKCYTKGLARKSWSASLFTSKYTIKGAYICESGNFIWFKMTLRGDKVKIEEVFGGWY